MKRSVSVIVATHKRYWMPQDSCYIPIHVGKEGKEDIGFLGDDTGENISAKNPYYCELTGLYWGWKNLNVDYIGLAHYRRHFSIVPWYKSIFRDKKKYVLTEKELNHLLDKVDVIVPKKRNYFIENVYTHYMHTHYPEPLEETRKIIEKKYPEYVEAFDKVMKRKSAHMFNMYIMKKDISDQYCKWLFDILLQLESSIDISSYNPFQARVYGRISELLLDVWLFKNEIQYKEIPVLHIEKVNWLKKGKKFLKSKFLRQYY